MQIDHEKEQTASRLRGSFLEFTKYFYKYITRREFIVSAPISRESHHIVIARELTKLFRLEIPNHRLLLNLPPGYGKSVLVSHWIAWTMATYPDSNFLYISYAHDLAASHTSFIKNIMLSPMYGYLFDVKIKLDSRAKDHFETEQGGTVTAFGSSGAVTGRNAGLPGLTRFSGAVIIDDPIKPDAGHSDTIREGVIKNYEETIRQRPRGINVPIVFIGQRIHQNDLAQFLLDGKDIVPWNSVILKSLDEIGNALYPEVDPAEKLLQLQEKSPYVFSSQYQQEPLPPGGALFRPEWFPILEKEPEMLVTFITVDTAESSRSYRDATAMGFYGIYEIESFDRKTGVLGLHWIDQIEIRVEPKDLKESFLDFYASCYLHEKPPMLSVIEKASTGTTLISVLRDMRGMQIKEVVRSSASGSKTDRFLAMQSYLASRRVSFTKNARHVEMCLDHMKKITANNTHRFDDIGDSLEMAVRVALIEKTIYAAVKHSDTRQHIMDGMQQSLNKKLNIGRARYGGYS